MDLFENSDFASLAALPGATEPRRTEARRAPAPARAADEDDDAMFGSISDLTAALENDIEDPFGAGPFVGRSEAGRESALADIPQAFFEPAAVRTRTDAESGEISLVLDESAFAGEPGGRAAPVARPAPRADAVPLVGIPSGFFDRVEDDRAIGLDAVPEAPEAVAAAQPRRAAPAPAPHRAGREASPDRRAPVADDSRGRGGTGTRLDPRDLPTHRRRASVSYDGPLVVPRGIAAIKRPSASSDASGASARTARVPITPAAPPDVPSPRGTAALHALAPQAPPSFPALPPAPPALGVPVRIDEVPHAAFGSDASAVPWCDGGDETRPPAARTEEARLPHVEDDAAPPDSSVTPASPAERVMETAPMNMVFGDADLTDLPDLYPERARPARPPVASDTAQLVVPQLASASVDVAPDEAELPDWDEDMVAHASDGSSGDGEAGSNDGSAGLAVMARIQPRRAFRRVAPGG